MFSKTFAPLEALLEKDWPNDVTEQHWISVFQNLRVEDITWRAHWIRLSALLYNLLCDSLYQLLMDWHNWSLPLRRQRPLKSQQTPPIDVACQNPFSEEILSEMELARHEFERKKSQNFMRY
ncbi:hypothetical protein Gotri_022823 [Gossypium trilobum]|uniref:Uncharacterized protein n=1 Tax=Gossypium trilobum TaxID=34281 RepID=A0A7J9DGZ5_9ROSI|nr:hypothetical protein [Gossypium trilobum]